MYLSGLTVFQFAFNFMNLNGSNVFKLNLCMSDCFDIFIYIGITGGGGEGEILLASFLPMSVKHSLQDSAIFILSIISSPFTFSLST